MNIVSNSLTLVMNGDWNKIYTDPVWIGQNIFNNEQVQIAIAGIGINYIISYNIGDITVSPNQNKFVFTCNNMSAEGIKIFEEKCRTFIKKATSPIINSYGYNIEFIESDTTLYSNIIDNMNDIKYMNESGVIHKETGIMHKMEFNSQIYQINFLRSGDNLNISINCHHEYNKDSSSLIIPENFILSFKQDSLSLLSFCGYSLDSEG